MTCAQAGPLLGAHLDNELDLRGALEVEEHLVACAGCRTALADLRALRDAARLHLYRFAPPPGLAARAGVRPRRRWRWPWLAGAGAALAVAALIVLLVRPTPELLDSEVLDAHVRSLLADHVTDVQSSDQHTVKPWFSGKVAFGVPVTDLAASGFPLLGGRLDYVGGREVAALVYRRRHHLVNAFVWPQPTESAPALRSARGYALVSWARGGLAWWLVSDATPADLLELRGLIEAAQTPP